MIITVCFGEVWNHWPRISFRGLFGPLPLASSKNC